MTPRAHDAPQRNTENEQGSPGSAVETAGRSFKRENATRRPPSYSVTVLLTVAPHGANPTEYDGRP